MLESDFPVIKFEFLSCYNFYWREEWTSFTHSQDSTVVVLFSTTTVLSFYKYFFDIWYPMNFDMPWNNKPNNLSTYFLISSFWRGYPIAIRILWHHLFRCVLLHRILFGIASRRVSSITLNLYVFEIIRATITSKGLYKKKSKMTLKK